jgi:hypothetical protein
MDIQSALKSQYHAALNTLREVIEKSPDSMWTDTADGFAPLSRVVYHTLFYTHFYLQPKEEDFTPWARHRDEAQFMSNLPWENNRPPKSCEPYTRDDLLEYWGVCNDMIDARVDALDLSAPLSGFPWYQMPKLDHQIVNIRHIQHHAAILSYRLRRATGIEVDWVSSGDSR